MLQVAYKRATLKCFYLRGRESAPTFPHEPDWRGNGRIFRGEG